MPGMQLLALGTMFSYRLGGIFFFVAVPMDLALKLDLQMTHAHCNIGEGLLNVMSIFRIVVKDYTFF